MTRAERRRKDCRRMGWKLEASSRSFPECRQRITTDERET